MSKLFTTELKRQWGLFKAYPMEEIVGAVMMAVFFYMLFLGAKYMAGPTAQFGTRLDGIVVGYVVWILLMQAFSSVSSDLQAEKTGGTLEQLMTSPYSSTKIFLMRACAGLTIQLGQIAVIAAIIMLLTGSRLHYDVAMFVPLVSIIAGAIGLGFMMGSLVFLLKRITVVAGMCQFFLLFMVMAPIEQFGSLGLYLGSLVPIAPSSAALRAIMVEQHTDPVLMTLAVVNGIAYFLAGLAVYKHGETNAKKKGQLGAF